MVHGTKRSGAYPILYAFSPALTRLEASWVQRIRCPTVPLSQKTYRICTYTHLPTRKSSSIAQHSVPACLIRIVPSSNTIEGIMGVENTVPNGTAALQNGTRSQKIVYVLQHGASFCLSLNQTNVLSKVTHLDNNFTKDLFVISSWYSHQILSSEQDSYQGFHWQIT